MNHHRFVSGTAAGSGIARVLARRVKLGSVLLLVALLFGMGAAGHAA
jgi:F0F1-type ATP synthase assembly protein I